MNLNAKVALSLILGASTLLSACDNKENTSTQVEKAVRVPAVSYTHLMCIVHFELH